MTQNMSNRDGRYDVDGLRPYPGLYSFREKDRGYFFGREREIEELAERIKSNILTVVLGKSGIGKTSLLQAGLIPELRGDYYLPIYVRIRYDDKESPLRQVKTVIERELKKLDKTLPSFGDSTLWEYFYRLRGSVFGEDIKPLLFFDQFEELFIAGKQNPAEVDPLVAEIGDLVQAWIPAAVQEKYKDRRLSGPGKKSGYRVIFSMREEYLARLKNLSPYMPSIVNGRYHFRVLQMKKGAAVAAVWGPGKKIIKNTAAAEEIVKKIPAAKDTDYRPYEEQNGSWQNEKIEPFLLSLFCYQVNERRLEKKAVEISRELIKDINAEDIIKDFYEENIARFAPRVKNAVENLLLTGSGHRKLQALDSLKTGYAVTDKDVAGLIDRRIIRKETRLDVEYIELIHDVLAPIIKESRDKRKEEEKRRKELEKRKRIYIRVITAVIGTAVLILTLLAIYAFQQKTIAEKEQRMTKAYDLAARSANLLEKDPAQSFHLAKEAYRMEKNNPGAYQALLKSFYAENFCPDLNKIIEFGGHTSESADFFAAFSPDGKGVLTVNPEKAILWDLSGSQVKEAGPKAGLKLRQFAAFSPDGKYIAFLTGEDDKIGLWKLERKEIDLLEFQCGVNSLAFSPDGKQILTGNRDNTARLWDLRGNPVALFRGHTGEVNAAAFSPGGKVIFTAGWDKTMGLWDIGGREKEKFSSFGGGINSAVFSKEGKYILTAGKDGIARLWDIGGEQRQVFEGHTGEVKFAVFSPGGKYIVTGSDDGTARLWNINGIRIFEFEEFDGINNASFSPDGRYLLLAPVHGPARMLLIEPGEIIRFANKHLPPEAR